MKILIITDIHANKLALDALFKFVDSEPKITPDETYCLGDIVGYYHDPVGVWETVKARVEVALAGNHEAALYELLNDRAEGLVLRRSAAISLMMHRALLRQQGNGLVEEFSEFSADARSRQPYVREIDGYRLVMVHGSPYPDKYDKDSHLNIYLLPRPDKEIELNNALASVEPPDELQPLIFVGHTHLPMVMSRYDEQMLRRIDGGRYFGAGKGYKPISVGDASEGQPMLISGGSVGLARRSHGQRDIRYANATGVVLDTTEGKLYFIAAPYDVDSLEPKLKHLCPSVCFEEDDFYLAHRLLRDLYLKSQSGFLSETDMARIKERPYTRCHNMEFEDLQEILLSETYDPRFEKLIDDLWDIEADALIHDLRNPDPGLSEKPYFYQWNEDGFRLRRTQDFLAGDLGEASD